MNPVLYAKGADVTAWRSAEDFVNAFQQAMTELAASDHCSSAETVLLDAAASIETAITTHRSLLKRLEHLTEELSTAARTADLKEYTLSFYGDLYRHFDIFRSAPAFYQLSMIFLSRASSAVIARAMEQLGPDADALPEMALIALGPAGRSEYSPFCRLQLLLVHGEAAGSRLRSIDKFCQNLHAGFDAAGLAVDPDVTPRNPEWRGAMTEWQHRFNEGLRTQAKKGLINLYRLVDQYPLCPEDRLAREFKQTSSDALSGNRLALATLIERMVALSNGLGIMGRLKLERIGRDRGLFRLIDNGLQPLSAALSSLAIVRKIGAVGNCERINALLRLGELDVEMAERMLSTWHTLHGLRLQREQFFKIGDQTGEAACLDPDKLTAAQQESLKEALESVAIIQRHVEIIFPGTGV